MFTGFLPIFLCNPNPSGPHGKQGTLFSEKYSFFKIIEFFRHTVQIFCQNGTEYKLGSNHEKIEVEIW